MSVVNMLSISASLDIQNAIPLEKMKKCITFVIHISNSSNNCFALFCRSIYIWRSTIIFTVKRASLLTAIGYWVVIGIFWQWEFTI